MKAAAAAAAAAARHAASTGFDWHSVTLTGNSRGAGVGAHRDLSAAADVDAGHGEHTTGVPPMCAMPLPARVAARATTSGTVMSEADSSKVFRPTTIDAEALSIASWGGLGSRRRRGHSAKAGRSEEISFRPYRPALRRP